MPAHPRRGETAEQRLGEMKPRRRRRHGAVLAGIDGLVVALVEAVRRPPGGDVGRQRHHADTCQGFVERRPGKIEAQEHLARLAAVDHRRIEAGEQAGIVARLARRRAEADAVADRQALGRPRQRLPARRRRAPGQRRLDLGDAAVADAFAGESRRDHPGVVEHQRVARPEQPRQVANKAVGGPLPRLHHQQAGRVTRHLRAERDQLLGQVEIEQVNAHRRFLAASAAGGKRRFLAWFPPPQPCRRWPPSTTATPSAIRITGHRMPQSKPARNERPKTTRTAPTIAVLITLRVMAPSR